MVPAAVAGFEPFTFSYTTVLLLLANKSARFIPDDSRFRCQEQFLNLNPWPFDQRVSVLLLYYHCQPKKDKPYHYFPCWWQQQWLDLSPWPFHHKASVTPLCYCYWPTREQGLFPMILAFVARSSCWIWTLDLFIIRQVSYHCATTASLKRTSLTIISSILVITALAGFEPWTFSFQGECYTTVLLLLANKRAKLIPNYSCVCC